MRTLVAGGVVLSPKASRALLRSHPGTEAAVDAEAARVRLLTARERDVLATVAMDRLPRRRRLAKPVIAVGTMSLTAYVGHFLAQSALSTSARTGTQQSWLPLIMYVLGAILFAATWSRFFRRGPLEYLLNTATKSAHRIR